MINFIDSKSWNDTFLKRRIQIYGYYLNCYNKPYISTNIPEQISLLAHRIEQELHLPLKTFNCVYINEFIPGHGMDVYTDREGNYGNTIVTVNLGSGSDMVFTYKDSKESIYMERRSMIVLQDDKRYKWRHSIPARKTDIVNNHKIPRNRRICITFRSILVN